MANKKAGRKKKKALLKREILTRRHFMKLTSSLFAAISLAVTAFNFALMISGGWDDISIFLALLAPAAAATAFMVAVLNVVKYKSRGIELLPSIIMMAVAGAMFCASIIGVSKIEADKKVASIDEKFISAEYICAHSMDGEAEVGIRMTSSRFWKIFNLNNLEEYVTGSYGFSELGDELYLNVRISENYAPKESGFDSVRYKMDFGDKTIFYSAPANFYCEQI